MCEIIGTPNIDSGRYTSTLLIKTEQMATPAHEHTHTHTHIHKHTYTHTLTQMVVGSRSYSLAVSFKLVLPRQKSFQSLPSFSLCTEGFFLTVEPVKTVNWGPMIITCKGIFQGHLFGALSHQSHALSFQNHSPGLLRTQSTKDTKFTCKAYSFFRTETTLHIMVKYSFILA